MALQRFYNATDKLVNAFIMGKIIHGKECSCAVGNLCDGNGEWAFVFQQNWLELAEKCTSGTMYSLEEIFNIEKCFEGRKKSQFDAQYKKFKVDFNSEDYDDTLDRFNDHDGFKGLCNVFDYMVSIEDWSEEESQANIFELFESVNN